MIVINQRKNSKRFENSDEKKNKIFHRFIYKFVKIYKKEEKIIKKSFEF